MIRKTKYKKNKRKIDRINRIKGLLKKANKQIEKLGKSFLTEEDYNYFKERLEVLDPELFKSIFFKRNNDW